MSPRLPLLACSFLLLVSCRSAHSTPIPPAPPITANVVATVNGTPITGAEVTGATRSEPSHGGVAADRDNDALERVIQEELLAQRAVSLGLDRDPAFRADYERAEASFHEWRRTQLAALFTHRQENQRATVSDADVRAYYDANATRIRTEVHLEQILVRDEAAATQALQDLHGGTTFDDVARRRFPGLPDTAGAPWDLGYLRWNLVPEPWRDVVNGMQPGQTSGIITGLNHRFWIIKLVDRRERPEYTFESMRPTIAQILQDERTISLRTQETADLRRTARIVYTPHPAH